MTGRYRDRFAFVMEKGGAVIRKGADGAAAGFVVADGALANISRNLDWPSIDLLKFLLAGTHGVGRNLDEARLVWESIPEQLRALGPERLDGFDWSHIVPYSKGGGHEAANGIFELAGLNRARGAEPMTGAEIEAAEHVLSQTAFTAALEEVASRALTGAAVGAAVSCVVACLEHGLEYQRGNIDRKEMYGRMGVAIASSAAVGAAVSGTITAAALAFPALIPLAAPLMLPLAAYGAFITGSKVVRLGKGWRELYRESPAAGFPIRLAIAGRPG